MFAPRSAWSIRQPRRPCWRPRRRRARSASRRRGGGSCPRRSPGEAPRRPGSSALSRCGNAVHLDPVLLGDLREHLRPPRVVDDLGDPVALAPARAGTRSRPSARRRPTRSGSRPGTRSSSQTIAVSARAPPMSIPTQIFEPSSIGVVPLAQACQAPAGSQAADPGRPLVQVEAPIGELGQRLALLAKARRR